MKNDFLDGVMNPCSSSGMTLFTLFHTWKSGLLPDSTARRMKTNNMKLKVHVGYGPDVQQQYRVGTASKV
ncbi:MAG TPA: hypothetical protein VJ577_01305 [Burkholderiaceae bacterium]|nr:hypothetical protein [Burkholderiaceae bacterium]